MSVLPKSAPALDAFDLRAALSVAAGAAVLGVGPLLVRASDFGFQATAFWRFVFAAPILFVLASFLAPRTEERKPKSRDLALLILAGVCFALDIALWHAALERTTVANATLLSNMTPVIAAGAGFVFFRERLDKSFLLGASGALLGAALLTFGRTKSGESALLGDLFGVFSALWYAAYLILLRDLRTRIDVWSAMAVTTAAAAAVAAVAVVVTGESFVPPGVDAAGWAVVVALGLGVHVLGQGLIASGLGRLPIARSTILLFIQPVAAAILGWIILGEALGPAAMLGAALVLGGVLIVQRARRPL